MTIWTLPASAPFLPALGQVIMADYGHDPLLLASVTVFLPTRRACRELREILVALAPAQAVLLPRIQPLGNIDDNDFSETGDDFTIPPALTPERRRVLLARLILAQPTLTYGMEQALRLADALAVLMDSVITEQASWDQLAKLVPADYAEHWGITVDFLKIITDLWPTILAAEQAIEPAARRNLLLQKTVAAWQNNPPTTPIIAAGSTGSIPAAADLLRVIASLPQGRVVLPALDTAMEEECWQVLPPTHGQFVLAQLLQRWGVSRAQVNIWPGYTAGPRDDMWRRVLHPAYGAQNPTNAQSNVPLALDGVSIVDCMTPEEEAMVIAFYIRMALENPDAKVMVVTNDRPLAQRVGAALRRWDIAANDSAGTALSKTALGIYFLLLLEAGLQQAAALPLLSLLKHPLVNANRAPGLVRHQVRHYEKKQLRGAALPPGLGNLPADPLIDYLATHMAPWFDACAAQTVQPLAYWLALHCRMAEGMAATDGVDGSALLWRDDVGAAAASLFLSLRGLDDITPPMTARDYAVFIQHHLEQVIVRDTRAAHPRVSILGPLEARLLSADHIILAGVNEGSWPVDSAADPFLSRPMRRDFGLPLPERAIGQAAHDFVHLASQPQVLITRSAKHNGSPAQPARWLLCLKTIAEKTEQLDALHRYAYLRDWVRAYDMPSVIRACPPPDPCPPLAARPRKLSVTSVARWRRDPYGLYASHILALPALDDIAVDPDSRFLGVVFHDILDHWASNNGGPLDTLLAYGKDEFQRRRLDQYPQAQFWWQRFYQVAHFVVEHYQQQKQLGLVIEGAEMCGHWEFSAPNGPFVLNARIDRLDKTQDGQYIVIDYKTGTRPKQELVINGYEPQLALMALMVEKGAFHRLDGDARVLVPQTVARTEYWELKRSDCAIRNPFKDVDLLQVLRQTETGLKQWVAQYDNPQQAYPAVPFGAVAPVYNPYAHLARVAEWRFDAADDDDDDGDVL